MEFYTASFEKRPVRLGEAVRQWAYESQKGKYGDEAIACMAVSMEDLLNVQELAPLKKQDLAIRRIAEQAPVRLCAEERVSGAATLGLAIRHRIPAEFKSHEGKTETLVSVSHHTPNYRRALTCGMEDYAREIRERLQDEGLSERQREFLLSLQNVVDSMRVWHNRYLEATKEAKPEIHALLQQVPFGPARTFHEAVQSLWFLFAFMRLCGNWPGIGRIDWLLGDYLKKDLAEGSITIDEAREIMASFFIKGCEWIESNTPIGSGDAQHYQNIVLAGIGEDGRDITNEVTYLVLDIIEELGISDFPVTVRINDQTPDKLLSRIGEVVRHGGGVIAVYNEKVVLEAMIRAGYDPKDVWKFANDGCWEVQLPGETNFGYLPFDGLQLFNSALGLDREQAPDYPDTDSVYQAFLNNLRMLVQDKYQHTVINEYEQLPEGWMSKGRCPCSVVSLFTDGCIVRASSYYDLGPNHNVRSPHIGGAPDIANSLYAIEKLVFEEKVITFQQLVQALKSNWEGFEAERRQARRLSYYGNDDEGADRWFARILNDFADIVLECEGGKTPILFVPGVSTFGRQIDWLPQRVATAFGAKQGTILSGNGSPTPGTDVSGATAIIRSHCKADMTRQTTGAALDIKLYPETVRGERGAAVIASLIRGFTELGGFFMQIDVVDAEVLRAAQEHPEEYKTLSVRVSGWNARFVTLNRQWQNMIIERTAQGV